MMTKKGAKQAKVRAREVGPHDTNLGHKIRLRRVEIGISQEQLGDKLGVSFQQVQKYEKGVNRVSSSRLVQIANALGVPISFFYEGDKASREVESLLFMDSAFSMRLLKAYSSIDDKDVQHRFVTLVESIAAAQ